jgi:predicted hotdog family 3-hydroxylacyl-ACP dehydratase
LLFAAEYFTFGRMNTEAAIYIPQRPPFVMIGEMLSTNEKLTRTSFTIKDDNILVKDGRLTEAGLVENMAQTAGAGTGYRIQQSGRPTPVGYIAALKNVNIFSLPKVNETITTEITFQQTLLSFHFVKGSVFVGDKEIANCEFKIFEQPAQ